MIQERVAIVTGAGRGIGRAIAFDLARHGHFVIVGELAEYGEQAALAIREDGGKAINFPLDELRDRLGEIPADKEIMVFCQTGLRSYLACRILSQKGFSCRNLSGGYKTYQAAASR